MRNTITLALAFAAPLALFAQTPVTRIALQQWGTGFNEPVCITHAGDDRLFVLNRAGMIKVVTDSMQVLSAPFLNITSRVNSGYGEQGLLAMAFDPGYADNGYFYLYYTADNGPGSSRISRFQVTSDPNVADASSEVILLTVQQPYLNHKGGSLHFGPDGYLYFGFGDGGNGNDPQNNAQNMGKMLGKMIRIDVSQHNDTYAIPPDNPFVGSTDTLPEIWASGLRNPWRWSFDRQTGDMWIGDVGQNAWEEVDFWPAGSGGGANFGWRCREGFVATPGVSQTGCAAQGQFVGPVAAFDHAAQGWCSVIGGYVYRGPSYARLQGKYIFTDYCAGDFITFGPNYALDTLLATNFSGRFSSFGEDAAGELYVTDMSNGRIWKLVDACPADPQVTFDGSTLSSTQANGWQWFRNGQAIPGATSGTFNPTENGSYTVLASYSGGCKLVSNAVDVTAMGIGKQMDFLPSVYPQPASSRLVLDAGSMAKPGYTVELLDSSGRQVRSMPWPQGDNVLSISVAGLPQGNYVVRGSLEGVVHWSRVVQVMH